MSDLAVSSPISQSATPDFMIRAASITIRALPYRNRLHLALSGPSLQEMRDGVEAELGLALPLDPSWVRTGGLSIFALGRRSWLIEGEAPESFDKISNIDLTKMGANLAPYSDAVKAFRLEGTAVRDLLATGCSIDLHPAAFGHRACARTLFARLNVVLSRDGDTFELRVERSFARHLQAWLDQAILEFGN